MKLLPGTPKNNYEHRNIKQLVTGFFARAANFRHHGFDLCDPVSFKSKERQAMVSKYHNIKSGGYDSLKEKRRAAELRLLERAGLISDLKEQVWFELIPSHFEVVNGKKKCIEQSCSYVADFTYIENGVLIAEDVKSPITRANPTYIIKRKLMLQAHGIKIREK